MVRLRPSCESVEVGEVCQAHPAWTMGLSQLAIFGKAEFAVTEEEWVSHFLTRRLPSHRPLARARASMSLVHMPLQRVPLFP